ACLLTLEMPGDPYPTLRTVLVYPSSFFAARSPDLRKWSGTSVPEPPLHELGEAWSNGTVVIAWEAAMLGGADAADGHNVVIHEFAHLIDFQLQITPALHLPARDGVGAAGWARVLTDGSERLAQLLSLGLPSVLDSYGTTNLAEFFAVATEAFFERPEELRAEYGELYRQLSGLYRQDPAG
ncbi:MAG: zinc-dependent peptidase, partial [Gemmatimonadales bacterium]